jgi:outer membrane protein assembly factor BamB
MAKRRFRVAVLPLVASLGVAGALFTAPALAAGPTARPGASLDWPQYLHGPQHSSVSAATAITPANAASVGQVWHWQPPVISARPTPVLEASPTVVGGLVYIGTGSGQFYALRESTGTIAWHRQLDTEPQGSCSARGITATAAVVPDPISSARTVYASGARYLYALDAATGVQLWKTKIGAAQVSNPDSYYNWSSPTVAGGHIYVGLSSSCDKPLIRGGVVELDQHTGTVLHTWYTVPAGSIGGSVWTSVATTSEGSDVWASTGNECDPTINACPTGNKIGHSLSIVHLSSSLSFLQAWQASGTAGGGHDWDFGSSPTLFGATGTPTDVGACNKNGNYYALRAKPLGTTPLWTDTLGAPSGPAGSCLAGALWNARAGTLFAAGPSTTIAGTGYGGSVRKINPATGSYLWQAGLPCAVVGTPTMDSAGVLAVGTYRCTSPNPPGAYLINSATGAVLKTLAPGSGRVFAQPVFAQNTVFLATESNGLYDFSF